MILKKETVEELSKDLSLPYTGVEQDWDIEMANFERIDEFIQFFIEKKLSKEKKIATMALILASYEDLLVQNGLKYDDRWNLIKTELKADIISFESLIDYWSLSNEFEQNNLFYITPLLRDIKED